MKPTLFITGSGSGTGKSTIAGHIHRSLERRAISTVCWYETDALKTPCFLPFFERFQQGHPKMDEALRVSWDTYFSEQVPISQAFIAESLVPFVRWLILGEVSPSRIEDFCHWLSVRMQERRPTSVVLTCPKPIAIERARRDRGEGWYELNQKRSRSFPLFKNNPELDSWYVFEQEKKYVAAFDWHHLDFDTTAESEAEIAEAVLGNFDLPEEAADNQIAFGDGRYRANDSNAHVAEITIRSDRIEIGGVWLDLIGRPDGSARIDRTNSTVQTTASGLELYSLSLGTVIYYSTNEDEE